MEPRKFLGKDLKLNDDDPELEYEPGVPNKFKVIKDGQRKLLIAEIEFLSLFWKEQEIPNPILLYVGSGPGLHIPILKELFPKFDYHLYDPRDFVPQIYSDKSIKTYNKFFTDEDAKMWADKDNVFFVCDIRTQGDEKSEEFAKGIDEDMLFQWKWMNIINPVFAHLKFRLPYEFTEETKYFEYPYGYLFKQPYVGNSSTELRLVTRSDYKLVNYNIEKVNNQLYYFNKYYKGGNLFLNPFDNTLTPPDPPRLLNDYDSLLELTIIITYMTKIKKMSGLNKKIVIEFSQSLTDRLNKISRKNDTLETLRDNTYLKKERYLEKIKIIEEETEEEKNKFSDSIDKSIKENYDENSTKVVEFTEKDFFLNSDDFREEYKSGSVNKIPCSFWGQRKLLISEMQFLTRYWDPIKYPKPLLLYIGAAFGSHIPILKEFFPQFTYHLYDPRGKEFVQQILKDRSIFKYTQYFEDEDAKKWAKRKDPVFIICDIRGEDIDGNEKEEHIIEQMNMQWGWVKIIKPIYAQLKFRVPFIDTIKYVVYPEGDLFKQVYTSCSSTELRLVVKHDNKIVNWDRKKIEDQMFYHNKEMRVNNKFLNPFTRDLTPIDSPELLNDYDSLVETFVIKEYLEKIQKVDVGNPEIVMFSRIITEGINNMEGKGKFKTIDSERKDTMKKGRFLDLRKKNKEKKI